MSQEYDRIVQRAAGFLARSHAESPRQRANREKWLAADPRHERAYRYLKRLDEDARRLGNDPDLRSLIDSDL
ncbi:FecR/PupR family sigma factor regulator [Luteimonas fraxinea]|uniref:FecR/PupR family sigma factor regulator n=1 Tax=Luteimonas fraxinea TaxID=2901869 RepID=UPI003CCD151E